MRPVPPCVPCVTARLGTAVPNAAVRASLQGSRAALPATGLGAMTAALVIVPSDPACARSVSAPDGRLPGSPVRPRKMPIGTPWMVRLSMGSGGNASAARLAPARRHLLGPHR